LLIDMMIVEQNHDCLTTLHASTLFVFSAFEQLLLIHLVS